MTEEARYKANRQILDIIDEYVQFYPELRFEQILANLNLDNIDYYRESKRTLEIVNIAHQKIIMETFKDE